jgi:hypothetical protein
MTDFHSPQRYVAARHVLSSPSIADRTLPHLNGGRVDCDGILAETPTMSGGERFLVDLAARLYSGAALPDAYELEGQLDVLNARRVAEARACLADVETPAFAQAA